MRILENIDIDIEKTKYVLNSGSLSNYDSIYFSSNEKLKSIFSNFDFEGMDILTVVGSGDQAFYFYDADAKSVDLFDKNKLSIYYYCLRVWVIQCYGSFYPKYPINQKYIDKLFSMVKPRCKLESDAFKYWCKFIHTFGTDGFINLFTWYSHPLLGANIISDLSEVKRRINNDFSFKNIDLVNDCIKKKYDVIYASNIHDYVNNKNCEIVSYRDNLYNMLNEHGMVVCSNVITYGIDKYEYKIFDEKFECKELPPVYMPAEHSLESPGYVYTKR